MQHLEKLIERESARLVEVEKCRAEVAGLKDFICTHKYVTLNSLHALVCTVEPLCRGHHWDPAGCSVQRGVPMSEVDFTQLYICDSALIREVSFIQSVLYREVPLYTSIPLST